MDVRVLRYFLSIIKEGSITQAAQSLHLTQPTISRQIKELEDELGKELFIRHKKGQIELTQEGLLLQHRAEEIIAMVDKTENEFRQLTEIIRGDIYIGGGESYLFKSIAKIIYQLSLQYPEIHYHFTSGNAADMQLLLDKGLLDFAIMSHPNQLAQYHYLELPYKDVWGLILPKSHPLTSKTSISRRDLNGIPLILSRQALTNSQSDNSFLNWMGDINQLNIVSTFNLISNSLYLVEEGMGGMIAFDKMISNQHLTFIPLEPRLTATHYIVWKKGKVFSPATQLFLEALQKLQS